jgi:predicted nucleotidyltransferase
MLTKQEISALVDQIVARVQPEKVIVFGSYAKGNATGKSDLDLLVVQHTSLPMRMRSNALLPIIDNMLIHIDVHVYTPEEVEEYSKEKFSFLDSVLNTGVVMYPVS